MSWKYVLATNFRQSLMDLDCLSSRDFCSAGNGDHFFHGDLYTLNQMSVHRLGIYFPISTTGFLKDMNLVQLVEP